MAIFYSDHREPRSASVAPYETWRAVDRYLEHYSNFLILNAIRASPKNLAEKAQAQKELDLCERKLRFWEKHPNYDKAAVLRGVEKLKRAWRNA